MSTTFHQLRIVIVVPVVFSKSVSVSAITTRREEVRVNNEHSTQTTVPLSAADQYRGGVPLDLVQLGLRFALGALVFAQGTTKWGWFGGTNPPGMGGLEQFLRIIGYEATSPLSWILTITEVTTGVLLMVGLFTPLAAAGAIGISFNGIFALSWTTGFANGYGLWIVMMAAAVAIAYLGPGRFALQSIRPLQSSIRLQRWLAGNRGAMLAIGLGVAAGVFVLTVPGPGFGSTPLP